MGLTLTRGYAGNGGGIFNNGGTVKVTNSTLSGNFADLGGGIYNNGGAVTVTGSAFSGNTAWRGGIHQRRWHGNGDEQHPQR